MDTTRLPVRILSPRRPASVSARRDMPAGWPLKIGASGSAPATARRRVASNPSSLRAARRNWGAMAAQLMSSASPALMPPSNGSTNRSRTACPAHDRITSPMLRSPAGPSPAGSGSAGSPGPASRARSSSGNSPGWTEPGSSGRPNTLPLGIGRSRSSSQREADRALGATNSSEMPNSAHRSAAHGTRTRKESAPSSTGSPAKVLVTSLPPGTGEASSTTTSSLGRSTMSLCAALRPVMPAPTTTTRLTVPVLIGSCS